MLIQDLNRLNRYDYIYDNKNRKVQIINIDWTKGVFTIEKYLKPPGKIIMYSSYMVDQVIENFTIHKKEDDSIKHQT